MDNHQPGHAAKSMPTATYGFTDTTGLTRFLLKIIVASLFLSIVSLWFGWLDAEIIRSVNDGVPVSEEQFEANDFRLEMLALVSEPIFFLETILFFIWVYRTNRNARVLGSKAMEYSPGWAVAWFIIPIANLYKPVKVLNEIWSASEAPDSNRNALLWDQTVNLWWSSWLLLNAVAITAVVMAISAVEPGELYNTALWWLGCDAAGVIYSVTTYMLVGRLFEMQINKARITG